MPAGARVRPQELQEIAQIAAKVKAEHPNTSLQEIGNIVGRSKQTVAKATNTDDFEIYKTKFKQKIDKRRFKAIEQADTLIMSKINKKAKMYALIGLSKTYYEQSFGLAEKQAANNNQVNVGVSIVREAPIVTHSVNTDDPEA